MAEEEASLQTVESGSGPRCCVAGALRGFPSATCPPLCVWGLQILGTGQMLDIVPLPLPVTRSLPESWANVALHPQLCLSRLTLQAPTGLICGGSDSW